MKTTDEKFDEWLVGLPDDTNKHFKKVGDCYLLGLDEDSNTYGAARAAFTAGAAAHEPKEANHTGLLSWLLYLMGGFNASPPSGLGRFDEVNNIDDAEKVARWLFETIRKDAMKSPKEANQWRPISELPDAGQVELYENNTGTIRVAFVEHCSAADFLCSDKNYTHWRYHHPPEPEPEKEEWEEAFEKYPLVEGRKNTRVVYCSSVAWEAFREIFNMGRNSTGKDKEPEPDAIEKAWEGCFPNDSNEAKVRGIWMPAEDYRAAVEHFLSTQGGGE